MLRLRSDDQLVAAFRAGDEDAFQVIHDRYRQRLFAYTRQMLAGSRQDAEDALQDVWFRAYASLRADDRPVSLRAWLYRVAHNRCIDQLRRPVPVHSDVFDVTRKPLHDPLEEAAQREDLKRLVRDVRRLPEAQRSALLMREMEGLSYEELAGALETTVPAIKSLLVRARIGLVESAEARDCACADIQRQLLLAYDKGVRASGQARRHMRECVPCREYRTQLRGVRRSFAALAPGGGGLLALLGIGGGAASAGGGGAAAAGGGSVAAGVVGGGAAMVTSAKVVAVVASVAVVTAGAATEMQKHTAPGHKAPVSPTAHVAVAPHAAPPVTVRRGLRSAVVGGKSKRVARAKGEALGAAALLAVDDAPIREPLVPLRTAPPSDEKIDVSRAGGFSAPDEPVPGAPLPPQAGASAGADTGHAGALTPLTGTSTAGHGGATTGTGNNASGSGTGTTSNDSASGTGSGFSSSSPSGSGSGSGTSGTTASTASSNPSGAGGGTATGSSTTSG